MCDVMTFPDNVDDFIEQYGIRDTEEVYTNGALLIPVFRVKQMLDYYFMERMCEFVDDSDGEPSPPKCSVCGYDPGIYECAWYEDGTYGYERNYCPNCGAKVLEEQNG